MLFIGLVAWSPTILEVSRANSFVWGLASWLVAGLAVTTSPSRYAIAGVALLVGALSRTETFVVLGIATVAIGSSFFVGHRDATPAERPPETAWPLLIGWLALPLACLHDFLLTGNPLYWLSVPTGYTAITLPTLAPTSPVAFLGDVADRYLEMPLLAVLGGLGICFLFVRRRWALALGLMGITMGIMLLLGVVAWRGIYITPRYFEQIDAGLTVGAAISFGATIEGLRRMFLRLVPTRSERLGGLAVAIAGAIVGLLIVSPNALWQPKFTAALAPARAASFNATVVEPKLAAFLVARGPSPAPAAVPGPHNLLVVDTQRASIVVPRPLWTRLAIELHVPLTELADSWLAFRESGALASIEPGQLIWHDRAADGHPSLFAPLEFEGSVNTGRTCLYAVSVDAGRRSWLLAVAP